MTTMVRQIARVLLLVAIAGVSGVSAQTAAEHFQRGKELADQMKFEDAIAEFTKAVEMDASFSDAYYHRGRARYSLNDKENAFKDYNKAIELNPRDHMYFLMRGHARMDSDLDGKIGDYTRSIDLNPKSQFAYQIRGRTKQKKGDFQGAIADLTKQLELAPGKSAFLFYRFRGQVYAEINKLAEALADFNRSIETYETGSALEDRAKIYDRTGEKAKAQADRARAIALQEKH
jgi:tetratricopeptide (TPR) repeat protein